MDNSIPLRKSTTSLEIISPFLYNMSITETHLLKNVLHLFHKKDDMLISTFESHDFLLTKYANIQKMIPSIFNSSAHKIYIAHTIVTYQLKFKKFQKNVIKIQRK